MGEGEIAGRGWEKVGEIDGYKIGGREKDSGGR